MSTILVNNLVHYHEECGEGAALVLIHGAFADSRMWEPQWQSFSSRFHLLRYDLRGHGRTGSSSQPGYTLETFVADLASLLQALDIRNPILCGQSFGGSIAQAFAVQHPAVPRALILAGSMVAIDLSLLDKFLCRVLVPRWAMMGVIRVMSVERFVRFSLWLGRMTKGRHFLGSREETGTYLRECMLAMSREEYLKTWGVMYGFHLLPLEKITCPTLVLNGEWEPKSMQPHTRTLLQRIPHARAALVPDAYHASNMDNPTAFNALVEEFLSSLG